MADHPVAGSHVCHVSTHLKHNCPGFVSKQMWKEFVRTFDTINLTDLRTTNARGVNIDEDLSAFERRNLDFIDEQRRTLLNQNGGLGFHRFLTTDNTDRF